MKAELTAIIEKAPEGGFWAICPEFPGANGQGETLEETKKSLCEAVQLITLDRFEDHFLDEIPPFAEYAERSPILPLS